MTSIIPAGFYSAVAVPVQTEEGPVWAQFGNSKAKGTPQVYVAFAILHGDYAGFRIGWFGYFADGSEDRTIESLRFCGFKGDDFATAIAGPLDQEVQIQVEHETYEGKVRAKVAWVNAPGGGSFRMAKTMGKDELRKFGATLKNKLRAKPEVAGPRREAPTPGAATAPPAPSSPPERQASSEPPPGWAQSRAPAADDDIPF